MTPLTVFITAGDVDTALGADEKTRLVAAGLTPERFAEVIADVNDEIAGFVGARILAAAPRAFVSHGCAIARYRLHSTKASDKVKDDHDLAYKFFDRVAKGDYYLAEVPAPADENASPGGWFIAQASRFSGKAY
jgi:phage gp36-like protein